MPVVEIICIYSFFNNSYALISLLLWWKYFFIHLNTHKPLVTELKG